MVMSYIHFAFGIITIWHTSHWNSCTFVCVVLSERLC